MHPDTRLSDVEASGLWWRPDAPDDGLPGTLRTHRSEEAELSLTGVWRNPDGTPVRESRVICGLADRIGWVVLLDCGPLLSGEMFAGSPHRTVGVRSTSCSADAVLAGDDLGPDCRLEFNRVVVEFSHLAKWAYALGVHAPIHDDVKRYDEYMDGLTVTFPRIAEAAAKIDDIAVEMKAWVATKSAASLGLNVEPKLGIVITRPSCVALDEWLDTVNDLREFFSLSIGVPVRSNRVWAYAQGTGDGHPARVEVHVPRSEPDRLWEDFHRHNMLVTYEEVVADFRVHIERWMQRTPKLLRACRQFLVARDGTTYAEQRFLSLARALEVLHASQDGRGSLMEDVRFRPVKDALCGVAHQMTTGDTLEALTKRIGNLNQASFQNRVSDLLKCAGEHLKLAQNGIPGLAKEIADWRHGFTHLLEGKDIGDSATADRVFCLCDLMEVTFEASVLPLLEFSTTSVHAIIQRKLEQRLPYVRELVSKAGAG